MKLSIITINLNNCGGLQKTIDSVIGQTFRDFEWIVIDGGSTDGSKELIEQYAEHFSYWVSEPDKGIYNAMNKGIKVAKGEYLLFLNSGDWLYQDSTLEEVFVLNPCEDVVYGYNMEYTGHIHIPPKKLDMLHFYRSTICHQATFIKSSLFIDCLYDESYRVVSDWKFLMMKILFENASYKRIDVPINRPQPGCSYDMQLLPEERNKVLNELFSPMELETLEHFAKIIDNPMRPYYDYLSDCPKLEKLVRRIVRFHKRFCS